MYNITVQKIRRTLVPEEKCESQFSSNVNWRKVGKSVLYAFIRAVEWRLFGTLRFTARSQCRQTSSSVSICRKRIRRHKQWLRCSEKASTRRWWKRESSRTQMTRSMSSLKVESLRVLHETDANEDEFWSNTVDTLWHDMTEVTVRSGKPFLFVYLAK